MPNLADIIENKLKALRQSPQTAPKPGTGAPEAKSVKAAPASTPPSSPPAPESAKPLPAMPPTAVNLPPPKEVMIEDDRSIQLSFPARC